MEQQSAFEGASKYTLNSIERCHELANFIKKRLAIEQEYARSLRALCKSVSLKPLQQPSKTGWFFSNAKVETGIQVNDAGQASLWGTFYEIIDDTSQVAKSHTAFAESLHHQLLDPLSSSINEMDNTRRHLVDQGVQLTKDLTEATKSLKKAHKVFEKSNKNLATQRAILERIQAQRTLGGSRELEKVQAKTRTAEERFVNARTSFRQQEEALKTMHNRIYSQEFPRIMNKLQQQEVQRGREALSYILALIELERRCAVMNENYANDMALKLKHINLVEDERRFTRTFMSIPLPPPLLNSSPPPTTMPSPPTITSEVSRPIGPLPDLPRTLSMPPAYDSAQETLNIPRYTTGSAAIIGAISMVNHPTTDHIRQLTMELSPSHPNANY